ncbi:MAG: LemA family protein [Sphingobium sp.]|nr:LemA family protein [Sphingobium sp.]
MGWFTFLLIVIAVWLFFSYNKLRGLAENVKRWQANIAATVKKRYDIAQRLSDIAASYGDHEKLTHFTVIEGETTVAQAAHAAADASRVIGNVQMMANRFPDLKANATYQQLMVQLDEIENTILTRREAYNEAAQTYNSTRGSLPHLFYAEKLGFAEAPYFSVDDAGAEQTLTFTTDDGKMLRDTMGRMANKAAAGAQQAAEKIKSVAQEHQHKRDVGGAPADVASPITSVEVSATDAAAVEAPENKQG